MHTDPTAGNNNQNTPPAQPDASESTNWRSQVNDVFFDYDKYALRQDARNILQANAKVLQDNNAGSLTLEGHCDERGTAEYNLALGQRRADAVKDYLVNLGMSASAIQTVSYGEERPFDPGHSESAWSQNRRVHFRIQ